MILLKPSGLWLKLFLKINSRGWKKKFTAETIEKLVGISRRYAYKLLEIMEKNGLIEMWYETTGGTPTRYYRMRVDKIIFTDGYVKYEFSAGLLWSIKIDLIKDKDQIPQQGEEQEDNQEHYSLNG